MNSVELRSLVERFKHASSLATLVDLFSDLPPAKSAVEIEMRIFAFRHVKNRLFDCDREGVEALKREVEEMKRILGASESD